MAPSMSSPLGIDLDLTYCTVKTGVNDFLDYIALVVSLVIPLILGPGLAGVGQVSPRGVFVCAEIHLWNPHASKTSSVDKLELGEEAKEIFQLR